MADGKNSIRINLNLNPNKYMDSEIIKLLGGLDSDGKITSAKAKDELFKLSLALNLKNFNHSPYVNLQDNTESNVNVHKGVNPYGNKHKDTDMNVSKRNDTEVNVNVQKDTEVTHKKEEPKKKQLSMKERALMVRNSGFGI